MEVVGQCDGNNREDVGVLCKSEVSGLSSNVGNMTCARDDDCFENNADEEHCNVSFSPARENFARVAACEVRCTVYTVDTMTRPRHEDPSNKRQKTGHWKTTTEEQIFTNTIDIRDMSLDPRFPLPSTMVSRHLLLGGAASSLTRCFWLIRDFSRTTFLVLYP